MAKQKFSPFSRRGGGSWRSHILAQSQKYLGLLFLAMVVSSPSLTLAQSELSSAAIPTGDETSLFQEIPSVWAASKNKQPVTEAPAVVTIITADEIKKYGYRTLIDVLQSVNGFYVTNDRNYYYLGVRGFGPPSDYNSRVLLLVDGHRMNDAVYDDALQSAEATIDVDVIERVEVIRGPSSSLYGTNAFFGVINIITKRGRDIKGVEVSSEIGSYDSYKGRFTYGNHFQNGAEFLFFGSFADSGGHGRLFYKEYDDPLTNNGIARNVDGSRHYDLFTNFSYADFSLQGSYSYRKKHIPTGSFGTVFNSSHNQTSDEHGFIDLKYEHEFANQLGLLVRLYYDRTFYHGRGLYDYSETDIPSLVLNQDFSFGEDWGNEIKITKRLWSKHKLTVGTEYRDNIRQDQKNFDDNPFTSYLDDHRNLQIWAFYIQDEYSIRDNLIVNGDNLLLNAGGRYDHYDSFGGTFNPRLALIYNLPKTSIKLLYGEAFRAPNAFEQYYVSSVAYKANPGLKPENIATYELVIEKYIGKHLRAVTTGYYYTIDDLISQTTDPNDGRLVFQNLRSIEAKGFELDLEGKWDFGLEGRLGYALQETHDRDTGGSLTNSPSNMVKFNVSVPLLQEKLFASLETRYLSGRKTLANKSTGDYTVTNLTLFTQNLIKNAEISGSIYNLFDEHYGDPGAGEHRQDIIIQDGRTFWLKLKYGF